MSKVNTLLFIASSFALTFRAIFPTSSTSFSIRFLISVNDVSTHTFRAIEVARSTIQ